MIKNVVLDIRSEEMLRVTRILLDEDKEEAFVFLQEMLKPEVDQGNRTVCSLFFSILSLLLLTGTPAHLQPQSSVQIYFFYSEDCQPCQVILQNDLRTLKSMFPSIEIKTFDVGNPACCEPLSNPEKRFKRRGEELPVVFIGDHILPGEMEIMERLDLLILKYQAKGRASLPSIPIPSITNPSDLSRTSHRSRQMLFCILSFIICCISPPRERY
jgi:hypothetical protein